MPNPRPSEHLLSFALDHPWALTPSMLAVVADVLARHLAGAKATADDLAAALVNRKNLPQPIEGGSVAVIPVYGVIAPRMNMLSDISGGTTFEALSKQLQEAMANKVVKTIVFDVDSPGGSVAGATEFAREVMKARTKKPIIAQAQFTMASAAYWFASAATEIVAAPSASVGSLGVFLIHNDLSKALAMLGINRTYISAGKYKTLGNETEPLSDTALAKLNAKVDAAYQQFAGDVAKGRGVPLADVKSGYGQGDSVSAADALSLGMVDRVATLNETLARLLTAAPAQTGAAATDTTSETADTPQEPSPATGQDRLSDAQWRNGVDRALFELDF